MSGVIRAFVAAIEILGHMDLVYVGRFMIIYHTTVASESALFWSDIVEERPTVACSASVDSIECCVHGSTRRYVTGKSEIMGVSITLVLRGP